jgi:hypothetical protein
MPDWFLKILRDGYVLETWYECKGHYHCLASFGKSDTVFPGEGATLKTAVGRAVEECSYRRKESQNLVGSPYPTPDEINQELDEADLEMERGDRAKMKA